MLSTPKSSLGNSTSYVPLFNDWMKNFSVSLTDQTEYTKRLQIFSETHDLIEAHNAGLNMDEKMFSCNYI